MIITRKIMYQLSVKSEGFTFTRNRVSLDLFAIFYLRAVCAPLPKPEPPLYLGVGGVILDQYPSQGNFGLTTHKLLY